MCQVSEGSTPSADWDCKSGFYPIENLTSTPTLDESVYTEATRSANWKTYTNTKYGFEFKYTPDFIIQEVSPTELGYLTPLVYFKTTDEKRLWVEFDNKVFG